MTTLNPRGHTMFRRSTTAATTALLAGLALSALPGAASAADYVSVKFDERGEHQFVVPDHVRSLKVNAVGERGGLAARGDGSLMAGGYGGDVTGWVTVKPLRRYWIEVDAGGSRGGGGRWPGGTGGGASVFRVCQRTAPFCDNFGSAQQSSLIVAGGGGGAAGGNPNNLGKGGNADAPGGASERVDGKATTGGNPGTQTAGGMPGLGLASGGGWGEAEKGGAGGGSTGYAGGGGGGGGYYGGGGGGASAFELPISGGGGGGGSNHIAGSVQAPVVKTATTADPSVTVTWLDEVKPVPFIGTPATNDTVAPETVIRGKAGMEMGDSEQVDIAIYAGSKAPGMELVQTLTATRNTNGDWTARPSKLAPGTYTALVTQRDWANNFGASTVTFRVQAERATPTPTPTPQPPAQAAKENPAPPVQPAQTAVRPLPPPALATAAIRIDTRRARITRGTLNVRLKCTGPAGQRCSGRLTLTAKSGKRTITLGSARYTVTAGRTSTVRVRIRPAALRQRSPRHVTVNAAASTKMASAVRTIAIG